MATFSGPAPTLHVQASFGYEGRVVVRTTAPPDRGRWHVETRVSSDPARFRSGDANWFYGTELAASWSYEATIHSYSDRNGPNAGPAETLPPYARFSIALYAWPEDASSAPAPLVAQAALPGRPLHIPMIDATDSVAYGGDRDRHGQDRPQRQDAARRAARRPGGAPQGHHDVDAGGHGDQRRRRRDAGDAQARPQHRVPLGAPPRR